MLCDSGQVTKHLSAFFSSYIVGLTIVSTSHSILRLKVLMFIKCLAKSQQFLYNCSYVLVMFLGAVLITYYIYELDLSSQQPYKRVVSSPLISQTRELRLRKDNSPSASELVSDIAGFKPRSARPELMTLCYSTFPALRFSVKPCKRPPLPYGYLESHRFVLAKYDIERTC